MATPKQIIIFCFVVFIENEENSFIQEENNKSLHD